MQMQLNRLKTKLATLRTNAVLNNCQSMNASRNVPGRRSASRNRPRNSPRFSTPIRQTRTLRSSLKLSESMVSNKGEESGSDVVMKEINLIKARLQEKEEDLIQRESEILLAMDNSGDTRLIRNSLSKLEQNLNREQNNLDRQRLSLAERASKFDNLQNDYLLKQDQFNESLCKLKQELNTLVECFD